MSKKKGRKQKIVHCYCEVWTADLWLAFGGKREDANIFLRKELDLAPEEYKDNPCSPASCLFVEGYKSVLIWFRDFVPPTEYAGHEALHAASYILRESHVPFSEDTEEAYAYLVQWTMKCIAKHVVDKKKSK